MWSGLNDRGMFEKHRSIKTQRRKRSVTFCVYVCLSDSVYVHDRMSQQVTESGNKYESSSVSMWLRETSSNSFTMLTQINLVCSGLDRTRSWDNDNMILNIPRQHPCPWLAKARALKTPNLSLIPPMCVLATLWFVDLQPTTEHKLSSPPHTHTLWFILSHNSQPSHSHLVNISF